MASTALLKVRFPDGTIRYGRYHATSDVPSFALVDELDGWDTLPMKWDGDAPEGHPVPVQIACDYGGGFWWWGTALPDRLVDRGYYMDGTAEICATQTDGYPDWWDEPVKKSGEDRALAVAEKWLESIGAPVEIPVRGLADVFSAFARSEFVHRLNGEADERGAYGTGWYRLGYYVIALNHFDVEKSFRALAVKYKDLNDGK